MAEAPLDCPGSWLPVRELLVGDVVVCELCGRRAGVTPPPPDDFQGDPWPGSKDPRVVVHWFVRSAASQ